LQIQSIQFGRNCKYNLTHPPTHPTTHPPTVGRHLPKLTACIAFIDHEAVLHPLRSRWQSLARLGLVVRLPMQPCLQFGEEAEDPMAIPQEEACILQDEVQ
jgi:hypothetical protein